MIKNNPSFVDLNEQTTFWGALMSLDESELKRQKSIGLSVLIHLSQFIDNIVLDKTLGIIKPSVIDEFGKLYEESYIIKKLGNENKIIKSYEIDKKYFDLNEDFIKKAMESFINDFKYLKKDKLYLLLSSRGQTYSLLRNIADKHKDKLGELQKTQYEIAIESLNKEDRELFFKQYLSTSFSKNEIVKIFHSYFRIKLYQFLLEKKVNGMGTEYENFTYSPNLFRQDFVEPIFNVKPYPSDVKKLMVEKLKSLSFEKYKKKPNEKKDVDDGEIFENISPIFIYCLINAEHPKDILENALELRDHKFAKKARNTIEKFIIDDNENKDNFKKSKFSQIEFEILKATEDLDNFLRAELLKNSIFKGEIANFNISLSIKITELIEFSSGIGYELSKNEYNIKKYVTEESKNLLIFMQPIIQKASNIFSVKKKIEEVFNCKLYNDLV